MKLQTLVGACLFSTAFSFSVWAAEPTDAEKVKGIQKMCSDSASAITERQAKKPLYERLGKEPKIKILAKKIIEAHANNPKIGHMFANMKKDRTIKNVADFLVMGSGGKANYQGRDMATVHRDLKITNGDFLSAGNDVQTVMRKMKYGENEVQEVVCALTAFVPIVVKQN
jgi:truncated hemoglobin YjbI